VSRVVSVWKSVKRLIFSIPRYTKQKHDGHGNCSDGMYSKHTLQRAYELPFAALFMENKGQKKYEASSVIVVSAMYIVLYYVDLRIKNSLHTTIGRRQCLCRV